MANQIGKILLLLSTAGFLNCSIALASPVFKDPLDHPAEMRSAVAERPMMATARAGARIVAVGSRGMIATSDDNGKTWIQSSVPVQSDLLSVQFPNDKEGWAVGHDGVILHSHDRGKTWTKQLDGRQAAELFRTFYKKRIDGGDISMARSLDQIELNYKAGPALPFLDVHFLDDKRGFVVGSFGMIAATSDGGQNWEPWLHRIENDQFLNLNSVRAIDGRLVVVGERGMVYILSKTEIPVFQKNTTGYAGSFFGITGQGDLLLAFGLRGSAYSSDDGGKRWQQVSMPSEATLVAAVEKGDKSGFILLNSSGTILLADKAFGKLKAIPPRKPMRSTGMTIAPDENLVLSGLNGIRIETLSK